MFILSKNIWLAIPPWLVCGIRCITSTVLAGVAVRRQELQAFELENIEAIVAASLMPVVVDLWNTVFLCWYLSKQTTAFKQYAFSFLLAVDLLLIPQYVTRSSQLINRLMVFSLEAGVVTRCVRGMMLRSKSSVVHAYFRSAAAIALAVSVSFRIGLLLALLT